MALHGRGLLRGTQVGVEVERMLRVALRHARNISLPRAVSCTIIDAITATTKPGERRRAGSRPSSAPTDTR